MTEIFILKFSDEINAREETIRRMQDIIDKSVGGIMSMSRPQSVVIPDPLSSQSPIENNEIQTRSTEIVR